MSPGAINVRALDIWSGCAGISQIAGAVCCVNCKVAHSEASYSLLSEYDLMKLREPVIK